MIFSSFRFFGNIFQDSSLFTAKWREKKLDLVCFRYMTLKQIIQEG